MSLGIKALREAPVESCRYLPTMPLELARPLGCWADLELSSSLADSQALAARITILPSTWYSCKSVLSVYNTPVALPDLSVSTSRTMALSYSVTLPVLRAGFTRQVEEEK